MDLQDLENWFGQVENDVFSTVGGESRLKVIILLACVLGLNSADQAAVGAIAGQLVTALGISYFQVGLLVTASTGVGALATLPMGILVDRIHRTKLLAISIVFWSAAMAICGVSNSFIMLLLARLGLGVVIATAVPVVASLTGDYFRAGVRGSIWGYILTGELIGVGFGLIVAGQAAALFSWRAAFWVLSAISLILAPIIWKLLPEPPRGNQNYLSRGKEEIPTTKEIKEHDLEKQEGENIRELDKVEKEVEEESIEPQESMILERDPADMPLWDAARYILSIRSNLYLIIASACGYFFFAGMRTFAVIYLRSRFGLSQSTGKMILVAIGIGAILGALTVGRVADKLIERGNISARIMVGGVAFTMTAILCLLGFSTSTLYIAVPIFFIAAAFLGGTNPPIDAARLDIMHSRLWGRAEGVRTTLRLSFVAVAPILFGLIASALGASASTFGLGRQAIENALALAHTFMIMLGPVFAAAIIILGILYWGNNPYPRDVATALASEETTRDEE